MYSLTGTDIFIRKSLVTNRRDTICEEAEEDIQPAEGPLKTGTEQCTDTKVPTVTQPEQEHPTHDIAPLVASDSPTGISPIIEVSSHSKTFLQFQVVPDSHRFLHDT